VSIIRVSLRRTRHNLLTMPVVRGFSSILGAHSDSMILPLLRVFPMSGSISTQSHLSKTQEYRLDRHICDSKRYSNFIHTKPGTIYMYQRSAIGFPFFSETRSVQPYHNAYPATRNVLSGPRRLTALHPKHVTSCQDRCALYPKRVSSGVDRCALYPKCGASGVDRCASELFFDA